MWRPMTMVDKFKRCKIMFWFNTKTNANTNTDNVVLSGGLGCLSVLSVRKFHFFGQKVKSIKS